MPNENLYLDRSGGKAETETDLEDAAAIAGGNLSKLEHVRLFPLLHNGVAIDDQHLAAGVAFVLGVVGLLIVPALGGSAGLKLVVSSHNHFAEERCLTTCCM